MADDTQRLAQLSRMRKPDLAQLDRRVSGHLWSETPPERWTKDDLISSILDAERREAGRG